MDETGFLKKGEKSVGVARQYTGTAGDTVNCQVGGSGSSSPTPPRRERLSWTGLSTYRGRGRATPYDVLGRTEAGVPEGIVFRNKIELAEEMLERAFEADVPAGWVLADSFYGMSHAFRVWLEERGRPYAVMVPKTNSAPLGGRK